MGRVKLLALTTVTAVAVAAIFAAVSRILDDPPVLHLQAKAVPVCPRTGTLESGIEDMPAGVLKRILDRATNDIYDASFTLSEHLVRALFGALELKGRFAVNGELYRETDGKVTRRPSCLVLFRRGQRELSGACFEDARFQTRLRKLLDLDTRPEVYFEIAFRAINEGQWLEPKLVYAYMDQVAPAGIGRGDQARSFEIALALIAIGDYENASAVPYKAWLKISNLPPGCLEGGPLDVRQKIANALPLAPVDDWPTGASPGVRNGSVVWVGRVTESIPRRF